MDTAKDQRRHPRIYLKVEVTGKIGEADLLLGSSRDISKEGMFVETHKSLSSVLQLSLRFNLPYVPVPVETRGRIMWAKSAEGEPSAVAPPTVSRWVRPGIGVHFEDMDEKNRALLNGFLEGNRKFDSDNHNLSDFIELPDKDIFTKAIPCFEWFDDYSRKGYWTYGRPLSSSCGNRVVIYDERLGRRREMIMMGSNSYLGLTTHPKVVRAAAAAVKKYGAGSGGVPQLSGTFDLTKRLEKKLAQWKGCEDAIIFPAGYSANVGTISALVRRDDAVIIDHLAHASLIDGCTLSKGHMEVFRHNDAADLENILKKCDRDYAGKLVIVDSVYSMDGDIAPLPQIRKVAHAYGARLMVDEAHASGVIGKRGRGIADHFNMEGEIDIVAGTLSKALGGVGGFVASRKEVVNYLRYYARSYFFSTSLPPSVLASVSAAIDVIEEEPHLRQRLWHNIRYVKERLVSSGFNIGNTESAIIPIIIGDEMILRKMSKRIHEEGIYLNPVPYPAVPRGKCRFRLSLMATHTKDDLDRTLEVLEKAGREFGVISSSPVSASKTLRLEVIKSISEIDENKWDSIVGKDRIICSYRYLRAVEESKINDCDYRYLLVYDGNELVAHACVYSMSFELDVLARGMIKKAISMTRKIFPNFLRLKFVECGTPVALGNTISFAGGIQRRDALSLIAKGMEGVAMSKKIGLTLLRDFTDKETAFFDHLGADGYVRVLNLPNAVMDCHWNSFEEYLGDLKSHYRNDIKKQIKQARDKGISVEVRDNFEDIAFDLLKLWKNTYDRAREYRREILTEDFFKNISFYLEEKSKVILLKRGAKTLGFMLVLSDDFILRCMFLGMDYKHSKECAIYFNSFYNTIKLAIEENKKKVEMGITTISTKAHLGAYVEPLFMYMKHSNHFLNSIITGIFKFVTPNAQHDSKRVFKNVAQERRHD